MATLAAANGAAAAAPTLPRVANQGPTKTGAGPANDTEILFYSLLLIASAETQQDLEDWAKKVLSELARRRGEGAAAAGAPGPEWLAPPGKTAPIYEPLQRACGSMDWLERETLGWIGGAIQAWRGAGQHDNLEYDKLRRQFKEQPLGPPGKKGRKQARWKDAIFGVAGLINSDRVELRRLLQMKKTADETLSAVEEIALLEAGVAEQGAEISALRKALRLKTDAHRKNAKRLQERRAAVSAALKKERAAAAKKRAAERKRQRETMDTKLVAAVKRCVAREVGDVAAREAATKKKLAKARARARNVEDVAKLAGKRLKRLKAAEADLKRLRQQLDERMAELDSGSSEDEECGEPAAKQARCAVEVRPRRDERGRWQAEDEDLHALRLAQLARGVSASTVPANVQDVLQLVEPELDVATPCERSSQLQRGEVTLCGEAMAAWKFAACKRVMTFGWDESTKFGDAVFSCNFQLEMFDGTVEDVCLRGLTILPDGGTSKALLHHIETRIFSYARRILSLWKEAHEKEHGAGSWAAVGGPSPENIGLHRLCDDTVLMTDTCNGARCTKRMLAEAIMRTIKEKVGTEAWEKMSTEERNAKYRVHRGDCWQHLRNIVIEAMARAGDAYVKDKLEDDLADFSSFERIEVEGSSVIRSAFKEFSEEGEYVFGRGPEFKVWRKKTHKTSLFIPFERAMGNRQDLKFDGCVPLFWNRLICLEFLRGYINCPKSAGVLDKSLYTRLRSNEFVALLRVNVLWKYLFSEPFRWLAGKTSKLDGWSLYKMGVVLDLVDKAMQEIVANPRRLLDPEFDIFAPIAAEVPEFDAWRKEQLERRVKAEDGTEHLIMQAVLREARVPTAGSGNEQATQLTLELAKAMAQAALDKMYDPKVALADKLESQDGINCFSKNKDAHEKTIGCDGTNDDVENKFAIGDYVMRTFRRISVFNASGVVQQRASHDFDRPLRVVSDRRKRKAGAEAEAAPCGFFWRLPRELRRSLVRMARRELPSALKGARGEKQAHDEEKLARREEAVQRQLDAAVEKYAAALELYDAWRAQGVKDKAALEARLKGLSASKQLGELRHQIEMRTVGCGWRQFETKWTFFSDERHHTIEKMRSMLLEDILPYEMALRRLKKLPAEAAPPQLTAHAIKALGTADADALRLEATSLFNVANLKLKAEAARERREAAGVSDRWEALQPEAPPPFDSRLVGKRLEVCWPYKADGATVKIWASGTVRRVADGLTDKASARAKKILPAGALLWAWDADPAYDEQAGEKWLVLLPQKWNAQVQYAWRFDPCELAPPGTARPPPRAPRFEERAPEDEYLDEEQPHVPRNAKK